MTSLRRLFGALVVAALLVSVTAVASAAKPKRPQTVVLRPRVHVVARQVSAVSADTRDVVFSAVGGGLTLIDDVAGTRSTVSLPSSCDDPGIPLMVGGGSLLTGCVPNGDYRRYSIASGTWAPISFGSLDREVVAVGSRWVEGYGEVAFNGNACSEHCGYAYSFVDVTTGRVMPALPGWHTGGTTVPDLNSPTLGARLCAPLRVPQGYPNDATLPSSAPNPLTFAGPFAVGIALRSTDPVSSTGNLLLQRCGTRLRRVLTTLAISYPVSAVPEDRFAINRHAVIWVNPRTRSLQGVFLPSLKPFQVSLGRSYASGAKGVFLTSRTLYVWSRAAGTPLIAMAAPANP